MKQAAAGPVSMGRTSVICFGLDEVASFDLVLDYKKLILASSSMVVQIALADSLSTSVGQTAGIILVTIDTWAEEALVQNRYVNQVGTILLFTTSQIVDQAWVTRAAAANDDCCFVFF